MDFGEYLRGGTAPIGKTKSPTNFNIAPSARPKTRAVDSDIQDTNLDLRNNRVKGSLSGSADFPDDALAEKEIARISLNEWGDAKGDNSNKRAPSRGKKSKDPTRKDNPLMPGVSAYTQNMPNIVLNNNRKPKGGAISNASPRTTKELRNLSQINELRAAYGADILSKPNSPAGKSKNPARTATAGDPTQNKFPTVDGGNPRDRTNLRKTSFETASVASSAASSKAEVETIERAREVGSNRSTPSSPFETGGSSPSRKLKKNSGLLKASFSSKHSDESNYDLNNLAGEPGSSHSPTEEEEHSDHRDRSNSISHLPRETSPDQLIPVDDFLEQVIAEGSKRTKKNKTISRGGSNSGSPLNVTPSHSNNNKQSSSSSAERRSPTVHKDSHSLQNPSIQQVASLSFSDYTLGAHLEPTADEVFADLKDQEIPEDEMLPVYDSREGKLSLQPPALTQPSNNTTAGLLYQENETNQPNSSVRQTRSYSEDPSAGRGGAPMKSLTIEGVEDSNTDNNHNQDGDPEETPRPQSRKLYLGSDKNMRDSSSSKVPRSAGARYGSYSPVKGGTEAPPPEITKVGTPKAKKSQFRKLSSHGDLADWIDDNGAAGGGGAGTVAVDQRPPSRQSTAFPVHLSSEPGTAGNSPAGAAPLVVSVNKMEGSGSEVDESTPRRPFSVNTEPKTVKKPSAIPLEETTNSRTGLLSANNNAPALAAPTNNATGPDPSYQVRPPSRQKVAAQHLFDKNPTVLHDNPSIESISLTARRSSSGPFSTGRRPDTASADFHEPLPDSTVGSRVSTGLRTTTAAGGSRAMTTRGKPTAHEFDSDYNDDGFAELDPNEDFAPFPITINYGYNEPVPPSSQAGARGGGSGAHVKGGNNGNGPSGGRLLVEDFPIDRSHDYSGKASSSSGKTRARNGSYGSPSRPSRNTIHHLEEVGSSGGAGGSMRPKSVTVVAPNSANSPSWGKSASLPYDAKQQEEATLRSRSANNYHAHQRLYHPIQSTNPTDQSADNHFHYQNQPPQLLQQQHHHLPSKPTKQHLPSSSQAPRTRAWGDQPDPRNIPRAQNVFGLEADTGWTSPALLGNPFSSTTINNDNFIIQDDGDDEMTILTEESEGYNNNLMVDNSLSVQSFNIETSLDEDFLKLFAPGR